MIDGSGLSIKETRKLEKLYFNPKTGHSVINDLARKSVLTNDKVKQFLDTVDTYTLYKPIIKNFETRKVYVKGIDDQFQADLVEMIPYARENDNYRYMLTCIDCFSKFAWVIRIKNKTADEVIKAFEKIFGCSIEKGALNL
jgi:hypothetical protein